MEDLRKYFKENVWRLMGISCRDGNFILDQLNKQDLGDCTHPIQTKASSVSVITKDEIQVRRVVHLESFYRVLACTIRSNSGLYAAQFFDQNTPIAKKLFSRVVNALQKVKHNNVTHLVHFIPDELIVITPLFDSNLGRIIEKRKSNYSSWISDEEINSWCLDIAKGLEHLHSQHIVHRNLKVIIFQKSME